LPWFQFTGKQMLNVGCVLYQKGTEPGTLIAKWSHSEFGSGTGKAIGGPTEGFAGNYFITYSDDDGREISNHDLCIEINGTFFNLKWSNSGVIRFLGHGIETPEGLVAGWRSMNRD
jgi:hypothetical protein